MKKSRGFSLVEAVIFIVVVGLAVGALTFMIGQVDRAAVEDEVLTIAEGLADGRMDYIQGLPFGSVASVARANIGGAFADYDSEITSEYVSGPSNLDTAVGGPTNYKKATVTVYSNSLPGSSVSLRCIKVSRS